MHSRSSHLSITWTAVCLRPGSLERSLASASANSHDHSESVLSVSMVVRPEGGVTEPRVPGSVSRKGGGEACLLDICSSSSRPVGTLDSVAQSGESGRGTRKGSPWRSMSPVDLGHVIEDANEGEGEEDDDNDDVAREKSFTVC